MFKKIGFFIMCIMLVVGAGCAPPSEDQRRYEEKVRIAEALINSGAELTADPPRLPYNPDNIDNIDFDLENILFPDLQGLSRKRLLDLAVATGRVSELDERMDHLAQVIEHEAEAAEFSENKNALIRMRDRVRHAKTELAKFYEIDGMSWLETRYLAVSYFTSHNAVSNLEVADLIDWARFFCHWEDGGQKYSNPLEDVQAYYTQPSLYSDYPERLRDYVGDFFADYSSYNSGRIRLRVNLGEYLNGAFDLPGLKDGIDRKLYVPDAGVFPGKGYFLQPARGFVPRANWSGRHGICLSSSIDYGVIVGENISAANRNAGLLVRLRNADDLVGDFSALDVDSERARRMVEGGQTYVYVDFFLRDVKPVSGERLEHEYREYFSMNHRVYGLFEANLIGVAVYDSRLTTQHLSGSGFARYGGGERQVDKLGAVLEFTRADD